MESNYLCTQQGMETSFRQYCSDLEQEPGMQVNKLCRPQFVQCDFESKTLCLRYTVQEWMKNPSGVMHGGIVATVFDLTMGLLARFCSGGSLSPTTNLQVAFLRPIPAGQTLIVNAECGLSGKTLCALTATAWLEGRPEKHTATASGTYFAGGGQRSGS